MQAGDYRQQNGGDYEDEELTGDFDDNVCLDDGADITITGALERGAQVGVFMRRTRLGAFTDTANENLAWNDPRCFSSNDPERAVGKYPSDYGATGQLFMDMFYTVTYENGGHGTAPDSKNVASYSDITLPDALSASGYTFTGWSGGGGCFNPGDTVLIATDTTFTAQWRAITATPPDITAITSLTGDDALTYGYHCGSITVTVSTDSDHTLSYQWYSRTNNSDNMIDGTTDATYNIPTGLAPGSYNYFCVVTATRDNGQQRGNGGRQRQNHSKGPGNV